MAENLGTVYWRVEADTTDLKKAEAEMDGVGKRAQDSGARVDKFGKQTEQAGKRTETSMRGAATAVKAATAALVAMGATRALSNTIKTGAQFQQSMAEVRSITRSTDEEFQKLTDTARHLGATTEFTGSQAASALKFLGMAGFTAAESMASIPQVLDLATAASMDLGQAADITSNIMSAFGIQAENASRVTDVLAASSSRANTDVSQLGAAMGYVGPVASALGVDIGDAAAAIGVLSDAGIQGSAAGTGLRRVMSSLANPTGAARDTLSSLGIAIEDVNPATNELAGIVETLAGAGLSAADALTIFGDRGGPAILALIENNPRLRELTGILSDVEGESSRMAATMRDTLIGDFKTLQSAVQDVQITFVNMFGDEMRGSVQSMTGAVRSFAEAIETVSLAHEQGRFDDLIQFFRDADEVTSRFYELTPLAKGFEALGVAVGMSADWFRELSQEVRAAEAAAVEFVGPIQGAGEAMAGFVGPVMQAVAATSELEESTGGVSEKATELIAKLHQEIEALQYAGVELAVFNALTQAGVDAASEQGQEIARLTRELYAGAAAQEAASAATEEANKLQKAQANALRDARRALNNQQIAARLSARDQAIFNAEVKALAEGYAPAAAAELGRLAGATYDNAEAVRFWTAAAENGARQRTAAEEAATRAMEENWQRTHEFVTITIMDIADNGGSAFERLGDIAVATAKRIAAEWLALKAMDLFGISMPGGMGGGSAGGVTGSIANSLIGKGASSLASSVAAGFGGGGGISGAILGNGTAGSGLVGAAGNAWGGISSAIGAIPGWGWAAMGTAAVAAALSKDPTPSTNAGILVGNAPGADPSRTFALDRFASGFQAQGFARREDQGAAMEIAQAFAGLDEKLTNAIRAAGGNVDLSRATLSGFSETGQGDGVFLGMASEKGKGVTSIPIEDQLAMYAQDLFRHVEGLDAELLNAVKSASSAEEAIRLLAEAVEGQEPPLNNFEKNQKSAAEAVVKAYESGMNELDAVDRAFKAFQQYAERGLTSEAIANFTGFMQSEIDSVLARGRAASTQAAAPVGGYSLFGSSEERRALLGLPINGSHATGLDYVPFDGYIAQLHRGERVQTAAEVRQADSMGGMLDAMKTQLARNTQLMLSVLQRWDQDGMPPVRSAT